MNRLLAGLCLVAVTSGVSGTVTDSAWAKEPAKADNVYNWVDLETGMWILNMSAGISLTGLPQAEQAAAEKLLKPEVLQAVKAGRAKEGTSATCHPVGPISMHIFATKFYFTPGQILIMTDTDMLAVRHIYTDGRTHKDAYPSFYGHSIGHWEGKTLIIDTVQLLPVQSVYGSQTTTATHLVERYTLTSPNKMHLSTTIEDPTTLVMPVQLEQDYSRHTDWDIQDVTCEEGNNRDAPDENGNHQLNLTPPN